MRCSGCNPRHRPPGNGFTLIEVVVGTVLIATFATSTLLAFRTHYRQLARADERLRAVAFADEAIASLLATPGGNLPSQRGGVAGEPDWRWSLVPVGRRLLTGVPVTIYRYRLTTRRNGGGLLTSVDFVKRSGNLPSTSSQ